MSEQGVILWPKFQKNISQLFSAVEEKDFFKAITEILLCYVKADFVVVFKILENGNALRVVDPDFELFDGTKKLIQVEKGTGTVGHVTKTRRPYFINLLSKDPLYRPVIYGGNERAELIFPLIFEGQVVATIHLFNSFKNEKNFDFEDVTMGLKILNELQGPVNSFQLFLKAKKLNETLTQLMNKNLDESEMQKEILTLFSKQISPRPLIGQSRCVNTLKMLLNKFSLTKEHFILIGEKGVGKDLFAANVHYQTHVNNRPLIILGGGSFFPQLEQLAEKYKSSEEYIFKKIVLEARGGSLYLRALEDMDLRSQTKILTYLKTFDCFFSENSHLEEKERTRIILSFNRNPQELVQEGKLIDEFLNLWSFFNVEIMSLRDRKEDIFPLANYFLSKINKGLEYKNFSNETVKVLNNYNWPSNTQELKMVIKKSFLFSEGKFIAPEDLSIECELIQRTQLGEEWDKHDITLDAVEKKHILQVLNYLKGNKTKAAKVLGITVKTLYNKLRYYGMV